MCSDRWFQSVGALLRVAHESPPSRFLASRDACELGRITLCASASAAGSQIWNFQPRPTKARLVGEAGFGDEFVGQDDAAAAVERQFAQFFR